MPDTASSDRIADLLAGLNPPQRDAVTHGEGPLLILAGAGTGKTRVLTHRIAFLEHTGMARANEILAITFTNKAAQEMRERVEVLLGRRTRAMWVMTFHAACARMLRAEAERLGYTRQFTIYDQADSRRLVKRSLDELGVDTKRYTPGAVHHQISDAKNKLRDSETYGQMVGSYFEQTVADAYRIYEREMHRMNAMDFDDLLVNAVNVLQLFQEVRDRYSTAFRHVLVDEYQDTNAVQYRWLQLLSSEHRNLAVVGDDAQSIYGFRGADIQNILSFEETFPDAHVVKLEQNYRSSQTILSAANAVIAHNREQKPKSLWTNLGQGEPIKIRELDDEHAEGRYVVGEIERLVDEGASRAEIAVFYRTNAQSRVIEDTLVRRDISYQVIGGTKFYERAEIKDAIAYLTVLGNPQDVVSFQRIVNSPRRGIGQTSLGRVTAHADAMGISIWEAAANADTVPGLGTAAVRALTRFMETMEILRERVEQRVPIGDLLESLLHDVGYIDALKAERTIEAQGREENLAELVEVAREFDATAEEGENTLDVFLQGVALVADADTRTDDEGLITLMTIHNAKGLEYPIVFIAGMEEGVFPHSRALDEGGLEEERRLAYVGVTRAMKSLYLTSARRRAVFGATQYGLRSRFLDEIPRELTDRADEPRIRPGVAAQRPGSWASSQASGRSEQPHSRVSNGRRCLARRVRRGRRHRRRGGRDRRRALRRRRQRAQAHGRIRSDHQALTRRIERHGGRDTRWEGDRRASAGGRRARRPGVQRAARRPGSRPGDDPHRRRPRVGGLRQGQAEGVRRGRHAGLQLPAAGRRHARRGRRAHRAPERRLRGERNPLPAAGARPPRRRRADRADRREQGRRRADPGQRRAARARPRGAAALHAVGRHAPARRRRRRSVGRRGGRHRALEPLRQADGPAAARRQRHGDDVPLAHAGPRRGLPPRRRAHRRCRPGARWSRPTGSSPAPRSSTSG